MKKLLILGFSIMLLACQSQEKKVNVYSARHYDTDVELYSRFTEETGIAVNLIDGSSDELIERIKSEGQNSPADVFITVDAGRMWRASESGILAPAGSNVINERIPENFRDPAGMWFSLTQRVRGFVYNIEKIGPEDLSTYEDLADPKWKGRVCVRSSNNIYNQSLLAAFVASKGEEGAENWAKGLVSNFARDPQGGDTDQIKAVAAGLCDVAIVNHYYYARFSETTEPGDKELASKVAFFFPNQETTGAHVNVSAAGLVKGAPNRSEAVSFLEYLTGEYAQKLLAEGNMEFPIAGNVALHPAMAKLGSFKSDVTNVSLYGANNPVAIRIMDRVGWK